LRGSFAKFVELMERAGRGDLPISLVPLSSGLLTRTKNSSGESPGFVQCSFMLTAARYLAV
jgi:hypothetical protein